MATKDAPLPEPTARQSRQHGRIRRNAKDSLPDLVMLFEQAAARRLDLSILTRELLTPEVDRAFEAAKYKRVGELLKQVLYQGADVRILVWGKFTAKMFSDSVKALIAELSQDRGSRGKLVIRTSGSEEYEKEIGHHVVGVNADRNDWILRRELPHPPLGAEPLEQQLMSETVFDTDDARKLAGPILMSFDRVFTAAGKSALGAGSRSLDAGRTTAG